MLIVFDLMTNNIPMMRKNEAWINLLTIIKFYLANG